MRLGGRIKISGIKSPHRAFMRSDFPIRWPPYLCLLLWLGAITKPLRQGSQRTNYVRTYIRSRLGGIITFHGYCCIGANERRRSQSDPTDFHTQCKLWPLSHTPSSFSRRRSTCVIRTKDSGAEMLKSSCIPFRYALMSPRRNFDSVKWLYFECN